MSVATSPIRASLALPADASSATASKRITVNRAPVYASSSLAGAATAVGDGTGTGVMLGPGCGDRVGSDSDVGTIPAHPVSSSAADAARTAIETVRLLDILAPPRWVGSQFPAMIDGFVCDMLPRMFPGIPEKNLPKGGVHRWA
ncbi:hypothetical protein GCM10023068_16610 [Leifsonia shinshuensis]